MLSDQAPSTAPRALPARWWILGALVLAVVTFDLNLTMINVALPTLATELGASSAELQWFSSAFSLMVAATLLPAGALGDRYGPKRPMLIALITLGVTALLCTQAASPGQLIAGQLVLGASAGFLPALSLALVKMLFPGSELTRALGIWSVGMTAGIPLGPIVGGYFTEQFGWTSIYVLNIPLVAISAVMLAVLLPRQYGSTRATLDLPGALLSSGAIASLVYGFTAAGEVGWISPHALAPIGAGAAILGLFIARLIRTDNPIIDLSLFRSRQFRSGVALATLVTFTLMGAVFTLPQYFHVLYGSDAMETGLRLMPIVVGLLGGVAVTGRLRAFLPRNAVISTGFALLALATALGAVTAGDERYAITALWLAVAGAGIGFAMPASIDLAMGSAPERLSGVASGTLQSIRQVGGTLGIAILGTLLAGAYSQRVSIAGLSATDAAAVQQTAARGLEVAGKHGDSALAASIRDAFATGMGTTLWASAGIALVGVAVAILFARTNTR